MLDGHVGMRRRLAHRAAAVRLVDGVGLGLVRVGVRGRGRVTVTVRVRVRVEVGDVGLCLGAERRRHGNLGAGVRPHPMLPLGTERLGRSSGVRRAARAQSLAPQAAGAASRGTTAKTAPSIVQQAAAALQPASICSVCSVVQWSSLRESGLEMCVPMFLRPW